MGVNINGTIVPGTVLKGFRPGMSRRAMALQEFPGVSGVGVVYLGKRERMLVIPQRIHHPTQFPTGDKLAYFLTSLRSLTDPPTEGNVTVGSAWGTRVFRYAHLFDVEEMSDIIRDEAGMLGGGYTCLVNLHVFQTYAAE